VSHPAYVSSDGGVGVMAMGPCVSERGRERRTGLTIMATPFRAWPTCQGRRRGETERQQAGDDRCVIRIGEERPGSPKLATSATLVLGGGV
jgi:hypothetical protein